MLLPNRCHQGPLLVRTLWFVVWKVIRCAAATMGAIATFIGLILMGVGRVQDDIFTIVMGLFVIVLGGCFFYLIKSDDRETAEESEVEYDEHWF